MNTHSFSPKPCGFVKMRHGGPDGEVPSGVKESKGSKRSKGSRIRACVSSRVEGPEQTRRSRALLVREGRFWIMGWSVVSAVSGATAASGCRDSDRGRVGVRRQRTKKPGGCPPGLIGFSLSLSRVVVCGRARHHGCHVHRHRGDHRGGHQRGHARGCPRHAHGPRLRG